MRNNKNKKIKMMKNKWNKRGKFNNRMEIM